MPLTEKIDKNVVKNLNNLLRGLRQMQKRISDEENGIQYSFATDWCDVYEYIAPTQNDRLRYADPAYSINLSKALEGYELYLTHHYLFNESEATVCLFPPHAEESMFDIYELLNRTQKDKEKAKNTMETIYKELVLSEQDYALFRKVKAEKELDKEEENKLKEFIEKLEPLLEDLRSLIDQMNKYNGILMLRELYKKDKFSHNYQKLFPPDVKIEHESLYPDDALVNSCFENLEEELKSKRNKVSLLRDISSIIFLQRINDAIVNMKRKVIFIICGKDTLIFNLVSYLIEQKVVTRNVTDLLWHTNTKRLYIHLRKAFKKTSDRRIWAEGAIKILKELKSQIIEIKDERQDATFHLVTDAFTRASKDWVKHYKVLSLRDAAVDIARIRESLSSISRGKQKGNKNKIETLDLFLSLSKSDIFKNILDECTDEALVDIKKESFAIGAFYTLTVETIKRIKSNLHIEIKFKNLVTLHSSQDGLIQILHLYSPTLLKEVKKYSENKSKIIFIKNEYNFIDLLNDVFSVKQLRLDAMLFLGYSYAILEDWQRLQRTMKLCQEINSVSPDNLKGLYKVEILYFQAVASKKMGRSWDENSLTKEQIKKSLDSYRKAYENIKDAISESEKISEDMETMHDNKKDCIPRLYKENASIVYMYHHLVKIALDMYGDNLQVDTGKHNIESIDTGIKQLENALEQCCLDNDKSFCRIKLAIFGNLAYQNVMKDNPDFEKASKYVRYLEDLPPCKEINYQQPWPYLQDTILWVKAKISHNNKNIEDLKEIDTDYKRLCNNNPWGKAKFKERPYVKDYESKIPLVFKQ